MTKHIHHQSKKEEVFSKAQSATPFQYEKTPSLSSESMKSEDLQSKAVEENSSIKLRAYQIHLEKGGSDLDNWLEAERSLQNSDNAK